MKLWLAALPTYDSKQVWDRTHGRDRVRQEVQRSRTALFISCWEQNLWRSSKPGADLYAQHLSTLNKDTFMSLHLLNKHVSSPPYSEESEVMNHHHLLMIWSMCRPTVLWSSPPSFSPLWSWWYRVEVDPRWCPAASAFSCVSCVGMGPDIVGLLHKRSQRAVSMEILLSTGNKMEDLELIVSS